MSLRPLLAEIIGRPPSTGQQDNVSFRQITDAVIGPEPPTPKSSRFGKYAESAILVHTPRDTLQPCEDRDEDGKICKVRDRHMNAYQTVPGLSAEYVPAYLDAVTITGPLRSKVGRGSPFQTPK
ncbi:hypothetical protein FOZ62_003318, partial [Perkinsus olseni]